MRIETIDFRLKKDVFFNIFNVTIIYENIISSILHFLRKKKEAVSK